MRGQNKTSGQPSKTTREIQSCLHYIQPSIGVGFKILVGAALFFPLDGQTKGELLRVQQNPIYVTFSFIRRARTSLLILFVDWLMRADYAPHSL